MAAVSSSSAAVPPASISAASALTAAAGAAGAAVAGSAAATLHQRGVLIGERLYSGVRISLENCVMPSERLSHTPSSLDRLESGVESELRELGCELVQAAGILLRLPQVAMATGQVLFQRFYYSKSFIKHNMEVVAMSCINLAAKIEEAPRRNRDVINVFHHLRQLRTNRVPSPLTLDQGYINTKNELIKSERRILKELGFCVHVKHPHKIIVVYLQALDCQKNQPLVQTAWNYMNDSLRTNVFVRYSPETIACACIYLSARTLQIPLPSRPAWFSLFGAEETELQDICLSILQLYTRRKPSLEQLESCVERRRVELQELRLRERGFCLEPNPGTPGRFSPASKPASPRCDPPPGTTGPGSASAPPSGGGAPTARTISPGGVSSSSALRSAKRRLDDPSSVPPHSGVVGADGAPHPAGGAPHPAADARGGAGGGREDAGARGGAGRSPHNNGQRKEERESKRRSHSRSRSPKRRRSTSMSSGSGASNPSPPPPPHHNRHHNRHHHPHHHQQQPHNHHHHHVLNHHASQSAGTAHSSAAPPSSSAGGGERGRRAPPPRAYADSNETLGEGRGRGGERGAGGAGVSKRPPRRSPSRSPPPPRRSRDPPPPKDRRSRGERGGDRGVDRDRGGERGGDRGDRAPSSSSSSRDHRGDVAGGPAAPRKMAKRHEERGHHRH